MRKLYTIILFFYVSTAFTQTKSYTVEATNLLKADKNFIWLNDTIRKDSIVYVNIKADSIRFKKINGEFTKWYYSGKVNKIFQPDGTHPFVYTDNSGTLHIDGNISQKGASYQTHAENVYTKQDKIILRDSATVGLSAGQYVGIVAHKYDGITDGQLVFDNTGTARVGDVGNEQPLTTRIESPENGQFAYWEGANTRLNFKSPTTSDVSEGTNKYYTDDRARGALSLTTSGNSGAATYSNGTFNIPNYTLSGLGGEPAFSKNTAFNKNFGTGSGEVAQGNDSRINNGQSAYTGLNASGLTTNYLIKWDGSKNVNSKIVEATGTITLLADNDNYNVVNINGSDNRPAILELRSAGNGSITTHLGQGDGWGDSYIKSALWVGGYTSDPTSGNKFAVNGNAYIGGNLTIPAEILINTNNARLRLQRLGPNYIDFNNGYNLIFRSISATDTDGVNALTLAPSGSVTANSNYFTTATNGYWASGANNYKVGWYEQSGKIQFRTGTDGADKITFETNGGITATGPISASSFKIPGGTSAQYLLADGSVTTTAGAVYKGQVDGSTGSGLADGTGTTGWYYACSVAGTHDYGSGNITLAVGDQLYYNGSIWLKVPGAGSYTLPVATTSTLGGVKGSSSVSVDGSGVMSVSTAYDATGTASSLMTTHNNTYDHSNIAKYNQWDGGSTGLNASTGRTSLGLGTSATYNSGDFEPANSNIQTHISNVSNPHNVTASQIGLGNVENTALSTGNAGSATKLQTARKINGVAFDGTQDVTVAAEPVNPVNGHVQLQGESVIHGSGLSNYATLIGSKIINATGNHMLIMFNAPFYTSATAQQFYIRLNIDGSIAQAYRGYIYSGYNQFSFQYLINVSKGYSYTIGLDWAADTNVYQDGIGDGSSVYYNRTLTIIQLP